jgi:dihydrofolate reductase
MAKVVCIAQQCLRAGLLDELVIHLMPVLLGDGRRLFAHLGAPVELEQTHLREAPQATHLRYRVLRPV